ncbi:MAG TPA: SH3 domain-containing protein [Pyrinomonadaceae bacterium]
MPNTKEILWFKQQFRVEIEAAVQGTPYTLDMLAAIASQETGSIWPFLRRAGLNTDRILELCVGDIIDGTSAGKGRRAFPINKADLLRHPKGAEMFGIARQAFEDMAKYVPGYKAYVPNQNKFCRGYGIFQLDLQFFRDDPEYFLEKRYANFSHCLAKCIGELRDKQANARGLGHLRDKTKLNDIEMAQLAIAYNSGSYDPSRGLMQGHYNRDEKKYYGQYFIEYLRLAHTVVVPEAAPATVTTQPPIVDDIAPPPPPPVVAPIVSSGPALVAPPTPVEATGKVYVVDVEFDPLNLREQPSKTAKVLTSLPDGHPVQAVSNKRVNDFLEVETSLHGAHYHGFAHTDYLKLAKGIETVPVPVPAATVTGTLPAIIMPRKATTLIRRTDPASAHTLHETGQPAGRKGKTPDELRAELNAIIDWLAVDKVSHKRYKPHGIVTYCNVYAHDYCHLAGVYLPRVWWSQLAIERLAQGQTVPARLEDTIDEMRANDLFRWLRDFGLRFGWQRTGNLSKLQEEANLGAVAVIVARRKLEGSSGHIAPVVPESASLMALRDSQGNVLRPVHSQAGAENFRRGLGNRQWWLGDEFAEYAFWVHA